MYWEGEWERLDLQLRSGLALMLFSLLSMTISFLAFTTVPGSSLLSVLVSSSQGLPQVSCSYFLFPCDTADYIVGFALYFSVRATQTVNPVLEEAFWRLYLYKLLPRTEKWKWGVSVMYSAYHIIVILRFSYLSQAVLSGIGLCLLGRVLVLVRESSGFLAACLLHSGLDIGLMGIWLYLLFVVS